MAKKSSNPIDAHRKAIKAKELKKNKEARTARRDTQNVKRDTRDLEAEIKQLKGQSKPSDDIKSRLKKLETELRNVKEAKEKFVAANPEAADKVYKTGRRGDGGDREGDGEGSSSQAGLYDENGKLRDPTRSIYFDPVYNPYGVPPPGMPYRERTPVEESSEEEEEDDSDDEIIMPEGPRPDEDSDDSDDSDDIPLPSGPPPSKPGPPPVMPRAMMQPPLPPVPFFRPPPVQPPTAWGWGDEVAYQPQPMAGGPSQHARPPRPYGARPPPVAHDPLSDGPSQTYQGHRMQHSLPSRPPSGSSSSIAVPPPASLPPRPDVETKTLPAAPSKPADYSVGAISAEPVMRDLRKEATAFVPRGVKRKKAAAPGGVSINATPGSGQVDEDGDERVVRRDEGGGLMGRLKGVFGDMPSGASAQTATGTKAGATGAAVGEEDEYQKFLAGLGDIS